MKCLPGNFKKSQHLIKKSDWSIYTDPCLVSSEFLGNSGAHGQFLNPKSAYWVQIIPLGCFPAVFWKAVTLVPWSQAQHPQTGNSEWIRSRLSANCLCQSIWIIFYVIQLERFWILKQDSSPWIWVGLSLLSPVECDKKCHHVTSKASS